MTALARAMHVAAIRRATTAAALAAGLALVPLAASADPTTEGALRGMVTAIDASPDWAAAFQGITTDATGATVMTGLKVTSAVTGMTIDVDTLAVTRGNGGADGRYSAARVTAGKVAVVAGPLAINLTNLALDDFAVPGGVGFVFDPMKPLSSVIGAYGIVAKSHIGQAKVGSLALSERLAATTSRVTYNDVTLTRLDGGKIATLSAGTLTTESPIADKLNPKPLVTISVAKADAKDIDFGALLRIYDPSVTGGSRSFQPAVGNATYRNAVITVPGVTVKLGTISLDDLKVRPPERPLTADLDRSVTIPFTDEAQSGDPAGMLNLLSAYSVGKFSATPIDITATGLDQLHLDGMSMSNLSLDGLGEFALAGFAAGVKDVASIKAGRIAVGGMTFPKSDVLATGLRTAFSGGDVDVSSMAPTVGYLEFGSVDANVIGFPSAHMGKLRLDFANPIQNIPTSVKFDVADTDLDAVLLPGLLREQLSHYGYTKLKTDVSGKIEWSEGKKQTTLSGVKLSVKDIGTVTIDAVLNGPTREEIEGLGSAASAQQIGNKVALQSGTLSFKDDSIVNRVINDQANGLKVEPDKFRDQFARGLPFMLLPVGTPDFQRKAAPVFADFVRAPGTITFTAAPAMPIPLPTLISAATSSGLFNLPTLLNLGVTGTPGAKPPASAPAAPAVAPPTPAPVAPTTLAPPAAGIAPTTPAPAPAPAK